MWYNVAALTTGQRRVPATRPYMAFFPGCLKSENRHTDPEIRCFVVNLLVFYLKRKNVCQNKKWLTVSNYSDSIDKCLSASLLTFFRIFDIII